MEFETIHQSAIDSSKVTMYGIDSPIGNIQIVDSTDEAGNRSTNFYMDAAKATGEYKKVVKRMLQ